MPTIHKLLERVWSDFVALNPSARKIRDLLICRGERVINDQISFRTFSDPRIGVDAVAARFLDDGYRPAGEHHWAEQRVVARRYEHNDPTLPRILISELQTDQLSPDVRAVVDRLLSQMPADLPAQRDFCIAGRPWTISWDDYERLRSFSEHAAWLAAFGFRADRFSILVNALTTLSTLEQVNDFLLSNGFQLDESRGRIRGSRERFVEHSATTPGWVDVQFADRVARIPTCSYEFTRRFTMPDGRLYLGPVDA